MSARSHSQTIGAMIDTVGGIAKAVEVADFNLIEARHFRARNMGKCGLLGFQRLDGNDLDAAPPTAQPNLVVVGGWPSL